MADGAAVWTTEHILALAPDESSAKAGRELATPRKWVRLGHSYFAVWGECQGSGANPYKTEIDLSEPAFKCSCPSRKFPCKHGIGLFLMFEAQPAIFPKAEPPAWVAEWLAARAKKAEQAAEKKEKSSTEQVADPAAQAKAAAQRQSRVGAGVQDLETWLGDLVRTGLSAAQSQSHHFWEGPAARLVDAQAPGLARMVRQMSGIPSSGEGWPDRLLERISKIHLLLEGYKRLETLPEGTQADVRTLIGWTQSQEDLLAQRGIRDNWAVLGQVVDDDEKLRTQRTWLWGQGSGHFALVLDFAYGNQPLDKSFAVGTALDATLVFFEGSYPQRAILKQRNAAPTALTSPGGMSIDEAMAAYASALSSNPWIERFALLLSNVIPSYDGTKASIRDHANHSSLPVSPRFEGGWQMLALSGGHPVTVFAEWNGAYITPISVWSPDRLVHL